MDTLSRIGIWFNRFLILAASFLFSFIAFKYLINPVDNANDVNITLGSVTAMSVARVGLGAFPLGIAIIIFSTMFSMKRSLTGMYILAVMISIITAVRVLGLAVDGATSFNLRVLRPELVIMTLSFIGIFLELRRRRIYDNEKLEQHTIKARITDQAVK